MKKAIALIFVLLIAACGAAGYLVYSRVNSSGAEKNARLGYKAMEDGNYERAYRLYGYALKGGDTAQKDKQIYEILGAYLDAEKALKAEDYYSGLEILDRAQSAASLPIGEDVANLRISLSHGLTVEDKLDALSKAISDENMTIAENIVNELNRLELTPGQRERYFALRRAMSRPSDTNDKTNDDVPLIYYTSSGGAALYADDDSSSAVLRRLEPGDEVEILRLSNSEYVSLQLPEDASHYVEVTVKGFCRVRCGNDEGYVLYTDLSPTPIYNDGSDEEEAPANSEDAGGTSDKAEDKDDAFASYTVTVNAPSLPGGELSIHTGPGDDYSVAGTITEKMVLTIIGEEDGWGKLKSGAGWIELAKCERN